MRIYEKLKKYIDEKGIKQTYISEKTKIPANTLNMILNGKRKLEVEEFEIICLALEIKPRLIMNTIEEREG